MNITIPKNGLRRLALFASLGVALFPTSAFPGTWTVVGIESYPASSPGIGLEGGSISLNTSNKTVTYGLHAGITGPVYDSSGWHNGAVRSPKAMGTFRWLLDWHASYLGEPEALTGLATITITGNAQCSALAREEVPGYSSTASSTLNDPYYVGPSATATSTTVGATVTDTKNHPNNGTQTITGGVGELVLTNDGSRHHTLLMSINTGASLNATGSVTPRGPNPELAFVNAIANAAVSVDATLKITAVNGSPVP